MTIEKSPAAASPHKAAARADSQSSKAKSPDAEAQGGGFMAILGALGDAPGAAATEGASADASTAQDHTPEDAALQNAALDAATLLQQNPQIAAAQAQAGAASAAATATSAAAMGTATDGSPRSATAGTGATDQALAADASQLPDASAKRLGAAPYLASAANAGAATAPVPLQGIAESATQGLQQAASHAKASKDALAAAADTTQTANGAAAAPSEKADAMKWMAALDTSKASQVTKAIESVFAPLLVKAEKSTSERTASALKTAEPGYSGTAFGVSTPDFSQPGAAAPITAPEMQVAEQVTYWVSQNVQNAELTLDGLGQSPVEVSISVQGKEAQINFRTDEAATRGVLEAASAHLKDLLQREGMVLSGVSVGTSGGRDASGDSSGAARRARHAARQGAIAPLQVGGVTAPETGRRVAAGAGRSVDLFV
jgi:flagellar hook-length control protein FliK